MRILIVDDHELLVDSVAAVLTARDHEVSIPRSLEHDEVVAAGETHRPDVVVLDLHLGERDATDLIAPLRDLGARVLVVTSESDRVALAECLEAGAVGVVHKSTPFERLLEAIETAADRRPVTSAADRDAMLTELAAARASRRARLEPFERLTRREREVLGALMDGYSAEQIAAEFYVSIATVRSQIRAVLSKLGVSTQIAAVAAARGAGWRP